MNNNSRIVAFLLSLVLLCVPFTLASAPSDDMDEAMMATVSDDNMDMDDMNDEEDEDDQDLFESDDDLDEDEDTSFKPV